MKYKTSDLTGALLDAAVAMAEGARMDQAAVAFIRASAPTIVMGEGVCTLSVLEFWSPSTDWKMGGPIIEREGIDLERHTEDVMGRTERWWEAYYRREGGSQCFIGPTALIAAMRAYVASKLGEEVVLS